MLVSANLDAPRNMQQTTDGLPSRNYARLIAVSGLTAILAVFLGVVLAGRSPTPTLLGIRAEFFLFAITLAGVALLHQRTLEVALTGLAAILLFKYAFTGF